MGRASRPPERAFTLLELIIVIAIVGLVAAIVPVALSGHALRAKRSATVSAVHADLLRTRLLAMEVAAPHTLDVTLAGEDNAMLRLTLSKSEAEEPIRERTVERHGLAVIPEPPDNDGPLTAGFDAKGRTRERTWWFEAADGPVGTIWSIRFDPISGDPSVRRENSD